MNREGPKLLAVDLDGTLLDTTGKPHEHDVRALRAAMLAGVRVSIITGRLYSGTRHVAAHLGLRGAVGCADGSHLVEAADHATLVHLGVQGAAVALVREVLSRASVTTFVFAKDAIGHDFAGAPFVTYVSTWSKDIRIVNDVFAHELWTAPDGVTAAIGIGDRQQIARAADDLRQGLGSAVFIATFPVRRLAASETWAILVRSAGGSKGTAIRWIAERDGIDLKDTVCVGDWMNDIPMFEVAGRSFAMGQAPYEVRSKATDVLRETVEEGGGVARAVAEAFGIRCD